MSDWYPVRIKLANEPGVHRAHGNYSGKNLRGRVVRVRPVDFVRKPFRCKPDVTVEVHHDDIREICGFDPDPDMQYLICDHQFHGD